jgi:hypothetical protein
MWFQIKAVLHIVLEAGLIWVSFLNPAYVQIPSLLLPEKHRGCFLQNHSLCRPTTTLDVFSEIESSFTTSTRVVLVRAPEWFPNNHSRCFFTSTGVLFSVVPSCRSRKTMTARRQRANHTPISAALCYPAPGDAAYPLFCTSLLPRAVLCYKVRDGFLSGGPLSGQTHFL